jgi:hypothetical protein
MFNAAKRITRKLQTSITIISATNKSTNLNSCLFATLLLNKQIKNKQYANSTTQIQNQQRNIQTNEAAAAHNEQVNK